MDNIYGGRNHSNNLLMETKDTITSSFPFSSTPKLPYFPWLGLHLDNITLFCSLDVPFSHRLDPYMGR